MTATGPDGRWNRRCPRCGAAIFKVRPQDEWICASCGWRGK